MWYQAEGEATAKCSPNQMAGVTVGLQIAIFLAALDQTVLNVIIPKISSQFSALDKSAWIITAYLLFSTIATPISGKLADIYGVKKVLTAATLCFGLASALCGAAGLAPHLLGLDAIDQLIIARALQGTAGGAMLGLCFVSIGEIFDVAERGKYQGFLAAAFIVAALIGPTLGGYVADVSSWRLLFYINVPLSIVAAACFTASFPPSSRALARRLIDYPGIAFFIGAIIPAILAAAEFGRLGHFSILSGGESIVALLSLAAFLQCEKTRPEPLIPLKLFKDKLIAISLITVFINGIGLFGSMLLLAYMMQEIQGLSASAAGLTLTPLMIVVAAASIAGGLIMSKTGRYKLLIMVALFLLGLGTFLISQLAQGFSTSTLIIDAAIGGLGLGLLLPVHTIIIQKVAAPDMLGVATSMTQFFRSMGGTIGTGLMSALLLYLLKTVSLQGAISQVLVLYAAVIVLTLFLNFFLPEVPLRKAGQS
ncbi:MAG: MFS transporter [Cyanobacteria bacterium SZAS TMP-1]|nr:MFS transporter [Cyanobacteria bacterium SZAS TMP-1]